MDEEILIDKDNDIKYLERLVSQNTFLMILITIIVISGLLIFAYIFMDDSEIDNYSCSLTQMSTQEIEAFNSQFTTYSGKQTGAQLKSLMGKLISNANTYKEEPEKLPVVEVTKYNGSDTNGNTANRPNNAGNDNELQDYINVLSEMRNKMENKHTFTVEFDYTTNGVLTTIHIYYNASEADGGAGGGATNSQGG